MAQTEMSVLEPASRRRSARTIAQATGLDAASIPGGAAIEDARRERGDLRAKTRMDRRDVRRRRA
jgi:hypothetical protein